MLTNKGMRRFVHNGYGYVMDKKSSDGQRIFWRCDNKGHGCKARLHTLTENDDVILEMNQHDHDSDAANIEVNHIKKEMKERALQTDEAPAQIMNRCTQSATQAVRGQMQTRDAARRMIQRARKIWDPDFRSNATRETFVVPNTLRTYEHAPGEFEPFLLGDYGVGTSDRILMFGRQSNREWTGHVSVLYVDGTFSLAPPLFAQVFVIMAERGGYVLPIAYFLLPDKREPSYKRAFDMLHEAFPELDPGVINMDFEMGIINAARSVFPLARLCGCLWHLTRNMRCKLAEESLLGQYRTNPSFSLHCRSIIALAFVPTENLVPAFEALATSGIPNMLSPILDWMEDNYIGRLNSDGSRRAPRFEHSLWSVYERTIRGESRTNNYAEAAHRKLQSEFAVDHPNSSKFITGLMKCQKGRDTQYEQYIRGDAPPTKRRKYINADRRIRRIVDSYNDRNIIEYLIGLAHNFMME
jgi:hypothetical protein